MAIPIPIGFPWDFPLPCTHVRHTALPATRHKRTHPTITPARQTAVLDTLEGWKAELTLVVGYIPKWFTSPLPTHPRVTGPGIERNTAYNRSRRRSRRTEPRHHNVLITVCRVDSGQHGQRLAARRVVERVHAIKHDLRRPSNGPYVHHTPSPLQSRDPTHVTLDRAIVHAGAETQVR